MKKLFGTSGIRGSVEDLFTKQFCFDIGRTFSIFLLNHNQKKGIAIGMDPRGSSPRIKEDIIAGLVSEGREIYDQGAAPIPAINYILKVSSEYSGSIMVSGSHIKPHLNGVKFFAFGEEILKEHELEIESIYLKVKGKKKHSLPKEHEIHIENSANTEYQNMLLSCTTQKCPKWKVVVDPGDGAQSDMMPEVLRRLGLDIVEINSTIQGEFYSRDTEVESDMDQLKKETLKRKADFGVGYDSDGDRVVFVDEKGQFIPGDYTGTLIAREQATSVVVTPINTSNVVDSIGKKVVRTKVGSPYVVEAMKKYKAGFGFEANGGGIFPDMLSRDGGRTTVEVLNLLTKNEKKFSELVAELPKYYISRSKVDYPPDKENDILDLAQKKFKGENVEKLDGLKIWIDKESWILFRSSKNAPEFRVFAESKSEVKSKDLLESGISLVKSVVS